MATKKRSSHKKRQHHGRRMGAIKPETQTALMMIAGAIAGAVAKRFADNAIAKQTAVTIDPKLLSFGEVVIGGGVAWYAKNPFLKGLGLGIAAEAGVSGLVAMQVLSGTDMALALDNRRLALPVPRPNLAGTTITPSVAGVNAYGFPQGSLGKSAKYAGIYG